MPGAPGPHRAGARFPFRIDSKRSNPEGPRPFAAAHFTIAAENHLTSWLKVNLIATTLAAVLVVHPALALPLLPLLLLLIPLLL